MDKIRDPVRRFLRRFIKDEALRDRTLRLIEPFFRYAEQDRYPLASEHVIDHGAAARAISAGGLTVVSKIRCISATRGFPKDEPKLCNVESYVMHLPYIFWKNRKDDLHGRLDPDLKQKIEVLLGLTIVEPLLRGFLKSHQDILAQVDGQLMVALWTCPIMVITYLVTYAILGDLAAYEEMVPLMELLPQAIPVGEPWDDLETWVILTA